MESKAGYAGIPPQNTAPPYQQQQQQPQVIMVNASQQQQQARPAVQQFQSYVGHIVFSCLVFWCCNWVFGLIAFILAS